MNRQDTGQPRGRWSGTTRSPSTTCGACPCRRSSASRMRSAGRRGEHRSQTCVAPCVPPGRALDGWEGRSGDPTVATGTASRSSAATSTGPMRDPSRPPVAATGLQAHRVRRCSRRRGLEGPVNWPVLSPVVSRRYELGDLNRCPRERVWPQTSLHTVGSAVVQWNGRRHGDDRACPGVQFEGPEACPTRTSHP